MNLAFVEQILDGENPLGRRMRYLERYGPASGLPFEEDTGGTPWFEVIGVVSDALVAGVEPGESEARLSGWE